jgi:hypothetical protein
LTLGGFDTIVIANGGGFPGVLRRALVFAAAVAVFALGLGLLGVLNSIPSIKEKRALAKIRLEEEALSKSFEVWVARSGYQRKSTGARDIYVPCLLVQVVNSTAARSRPATMRATFLRNGQSFCAAAGSVPVLEPGAGCELWLKCIELTGFGAVARGVSLAETTEPMDYMVWLGSGGVSIVIAKDSLKTVLLE